MGTPIPRPSARLLLVDDQERVLLLKSVDARQDDPVFWFTPGGALEPGESYEQAAHRELREETGISNVTLGPWVWSRRHIFGMAGVRYDSIERFFIVRTNVVQLDFSGLQAIEREVIREHRWWSAAEILAATHELFVPRRMGSLLVPLLAGQVTSMPIETGA